MTTTLSQGFKWFYFLLISIVSMHSASAYAYTCPTKVTDAIASGPVPNVDPPPPSGTPALDIDSVYQFIRNNNITSLKSMLSVMPDHMKKHYALIEKSRALHQSSATLPNITMYSVDGTFMLNIGVISNDPLYEVVDMTYLQDEDDGARNGVWRFASIDFRTNPPSLTNDTKNATTVCNDCHGNPPLPIWGKYLVWNDVIGDIKGQQSENLESGEASVINNTIRPSQLTHSRYHSIVLPSQSSVATGRTLVLPDIYYPYSLTNSTMEMGTAMVKSIVTRMKKVLYLPA